MARGSVKICANVFNWKMGGGNDWLGVGLGPISGYLTV